MKKLAVSLVVALVLGASATSRADDCQSVSGNKQKGATEQQVQSTEESGSSHNVQSASGGKETTPPKKK